MPRKICVFRIYFLIILASASLLFGMNGRRLADRWPVLDIYRELELRGHISNQPNTWPDRSGRVLRNLPDETAGPAGFWSSELRGQLERTSFQQDTLLFFIEPGINGILNNPRDPDDRFYPTLRLGGGKELGRIEGFVSYIVNLRWAHEDNYRGRQWAGFAGRPDQVYLRTSGDNWGLQLGKDYISWGEGLMLGREHTPFESLDFELEFGPFNFSGFTGFLNSMMYFEPFMTDSFIGRYANRYLAGHRLEFVSEHFSIALNEIMLYGGLGRMPEISYVVPFYWYHAEQLNRGLDDNTFLGGDFKVLFPPVRFTGEVLVDDIQVESETQSDEEPPEIGIAGQLDYGGTVFSKWVTLRARYEGVTNWTYNQNKLWNRYIYLDEYLGSKYGNDYDRSSFGIDLFVAPEFIFNIEGFYFRKGEGRVDAVWNTPWMDIEGPYSEPFPTGVVEKTAGFNLDWKGYYREYGFWKFGFEYGSVENAGHVSGKTADYWQLDLQLDVPLYPQLGY